MPVELSDFETLEYCKILNPVSMGWGAPLIEADLGAGFRAGVLANSSYGLHRWVIASEFIPDTDDYEVDYDVDGTPTTNPRFTYVFEFFKRHIERGNKPFIFADKRTGKDYLVQFVEPSVDFGMITAKFLSAEGIQVVEARHADINFNSDGSLPTDTEAPTIPTGLATTNEGAGGFDASFNAATDNVAVTGYKLRLNGGAYTNHEIDVGNDTTPTVTGLTLVDGTTYTLEVAAYDAASNQSNWSSSINVSWSSAGYDSDAQAWIDKVELTDSPSTSQKDAFDDFFVDLKAFGIYTKIPAFWIFWGGSADGHKWNGIDPRDLDAAFRLTYYGTITHDSNGFTPNGSTGYADTHFNQLNDGAEDDEGLAVYSRTNATNNGVDIGSWDGTGGTHLICRNSNGMVCRNQCDGVDIVANGRSDGFCMISRVGAGQYRGQRDAVTTVVSESSDYALQNVTHFIGARNNSGTAENFSSRNLAFAAVTDGLNATEMANFNTAVADLMTALGLNV